ncbi:MAG: hypothetical protein KDD65_08595 [Bacteroidetes bacterium]|nr:hypothetical protein [Bacteroidota bacterium]
MNQICVPIPHPGSNHFVTLEVTVDGEKRVINYRVESFPWSDSDNLSKRIDTLREFLKDYDSSWELMQIGPPDGGSINVTFRQLQEVAAG